MLTTSISKSKSIEEIADFWDNNSLADYWDETEEVEFKVRAKKRRRITIDPEIYEQVNTQARIRGLIPETLINLWLYECIQEFRFPRAEFQRRLK